MITFSASSLKQFASPLGGLARALLALGVASMLSSIALTNAHGQASSPRNQNIQLIDRVLAIVNREVITASELARRERQFVAGLTQQGIAIPSRAILREQVLERMITD
ncbi:MAG: hypothetical protein ACKOCR_08420, partial [Burkholderiaceae bacterium]